MEEDACVSLIRMLLFPDQLNVIAMRQESESTLKDCT